MSRVGSVAIVLNGVPGSGKTTLAPLLARELGFPVVARDAIKEALADAVAVPLPTSSGFDARVAIVGGLA